MIFSTMKLKLSLVRLYGGLENLKISGVIQTVLSRT